MSSDDIFPVALCIVALVTLAMMFWVWDDAEKRGRPGFLWALISVILWPVGLVAYLIVRQLDDNRPGTHRRKKSRKRRR